MGIDLEKGEIDENSETATWHVRFYGAKDAKEMEDLLIKKKDWASIKLACGKGVIPPWAGRGDVPNGKKPEQPDYTLLQV